MGLGRLSTCSQPVQRGNSARDRSAGCRGRDRRPAPPGLVAPCGAGSLSSKATGGHHEGRPAVRVRTSGPAAKPGERAGWRGSGRRSPGRWGGCADGGCPWRSPSSESGWSSRLVESRRNQARAAWCQHCSSTGAGTTSEGGFSWWRGTPARPSRGRASAPPGSKLTANVSSLRLRGWLTTRSRSAGSARSCSTARDPLALAEFWARVVGGHADGVVRRLGHPRASTARPAALLPAQRHRPWSRRCTSTCSSRTWSWPTKPCRGRCVYVEERWSPRPGPDGEPVPWRVYADPEGHLFCLVVR